MKRHPTRIRNCFTDFPDWRKDYVIGNHSEVSRHENTVGTDSILCYFVKGSRRYWFERDPSWDIHMWLDLDGLRSIRSLPLSTREIWDA